MTTVQLDARPDLETIREAYARIRPHIHRTPVMTCRALDAMAGAQLFFKCENFQKGGAFKARGATNAVLMLSEEIARRGVVTHSSGNHAAALSLAASFRGIKAYIVVPSNAPAPKVAAIKGYGGRITFCEPTLAARESTTARLMAEKEVYLIHPYNNHHVMAGQGTCALELLEQLQEGSAAPPDMILAPVGGGGLVSGTAIVAKSLHPQLKVIGCEPHGADDARRSKKSGKLIPQTNPKTIADGLRSSLGEKTFAVIRELVDDIVTVEEDEIVAAMRHVWERMKIIIEPSSAVPVAAALFHKISGMAGKRVGIILSGGNVDVDHLPFKISKPRRKAKR
ncbi:MAG: pyridoxal-phosphate dependent enzyme [Acidobacteriia bacterium]|nr:pyridoxal-phosphate dependent enzyme [Terriglobia bacterium]